MPGDVFVSYSRRDEEFVLRLVDDLEDRQALAWIDRGNIHGGEQWRASIENGIRDAKAFVLVISPNSIASGNVVEELDIAIQLGKPIIPLIYRPAKMSADLNQRLRRYQILDFGRGGYTQNLLDLFDALVNLGVGLEVDRADLAERRRVRLGARVDTEWRAVLSRIPGWALAWGFGWALFWVIVPIALFIAMSPEDAGLYRHYLVFPLGGFAGGLVGGLIAGLFTMISLRHHASSIRWRHMSPAIPIWGIVGPIGVIAAGAVAAAGVRIQEVARPACTGDAAQCFGEAVGQAIAEALAYAILAVIAVVLFSVVVVFLIGCVAAWLVVRRIRRLEPGIIGRQTAGVTVGWGCGSLVAALSAILAAIFIADAIGMT